MMVLVLVVAMAMSMSVLYTRAGVSAQAALLSNWPEVACAVFIHELPCLPRRPYCWTGLRISL